MRLINADALIERIQGPCTKEQIIGLIHTAPTILEWPDFIPPQVYEHDADWHLEHKAMGFSDPIADVIEMLMGEDDKPQ